MTSNHHAPYDLGYTYTMGVNRRKQWTARWSKPEKHSLSSDRRLQLAYVKSESLVIASRILDMGEYSRALHTARHTTKVGSAQSRWG